MTVRDYTNVTEVPGLAVSRIQLARDAHRYYVAASQLGGGDILEAACGAGQGLGYLARRARSVVGGDYTPQHVDLARSHYHGRIPLVELDAQALPFRDASFDGVALLEAIYYLPDASRFVSESRRILRRGGRLVISSVNPAWRDFARSPHSTRYFDSRELHELVGAAGFAVEMFGAFRDRHDLTSRIRSLVRRAAIRSALIPGSLAAKAMLKRFFYGPLVRQPAELPEGDPTEPLVRIDPTTREVECSILYAVGHLDGV